MKKHSRNGLLELQFDRHLHRLQVERLYTSQLDSDITRISVDLTKRKGQLKGSKSEISAVSLVKELANNLARNINHLDELTSGNVELRGKINDMRLELKAERERIRQRKEEIEAMYGKASQMKTEREIAERSSDSYRAQIRSFSIDSSKDFLQKPRTAYAAKPRAKQTLSFFPPLQADLHSKEVLQYLLASWESKIRLKRQAIITHQNFISTLKEGFAVMQNPDISQVTAEIISWAGKERSLKATLSTVQDSITTAQSAVLSCRSTMHNLLSAEKDRDWRNVQLLLTAAPLLSKCIQETPPASVKSAEDLETWMRGKAALCGEEMKKKGTVEVISAQVIGDLLQAIWKSLQSLKPILFEAGLYPSDFQIDRDFSIDVLTGLIYELELTFTRLAVLLRRRGLLALRENSQLSPKSRGRLRPVTSQAAGPEVDRPLTKAEFRERAMALALGNQ